MGDRPVYYREEEDAFGNTIIIPVDHIPGGGKWTPGRVISFIFLLLLLPVLYVLLPSLLNIDKPIPGVTQEQCIPVLIGAAVLSFIAALIYGRTKKSKAYYGGFVATAGFTFGIAVALAFFGYIVYMQMTVNGKTLSDFLHISFGKDFAEGFGNYLKYFLVSIGVIVASAIVGTVTSFIPYIIFTLKYRRRR